MSANSPETQKLLDQVGKGDSSAVELLLNQYRESLRRLVELRLDPVVARTIQAGDILQMALLEAAHQLPNYVKNPRMPFQRWLQSIANHHLNDAKRKHELAQRQSIRSEHPVVQSQAWYRFDTDSNKNPYAFIDHSVMRADGEFLDWSHKDGMRCTLKVGRKRMLDVAYAMGGALLFSERAKTVCLQFRMQKELAWSPVEVSHSDKAKDSYWALTCSAGIEALDLDRSGITWGPSGKIIHSISRFVLDNKRIPDLDFFFLEERSNERIVSAAFRDAFLAEGLTGAVFHPVFHPCQVS
jgi:DNA-directed RNA polymerase specialized sigma24 family protein